MINIRKSEECGHADHGWLNARHSFSFAEYHDPAHMQYSVLRVINEDVIAAGRGFSEHPHRNMEIVTYILSGELRHQDSMGNGSVIGVCDVQRMTAGTGVRHSEFNASSESPVHLLQIWIMPSESNLTPSYEEKHFSVEQKTNQWCRIVAPNEQQGAIKIHQDVTIDAAHLAAGKGLVIVLKENRCAYLQVVKGEVLFDGKALSAGDAAMVDAGYYQLTAQQAAELILFDLPVVETGNQ
ncbi:MAG: redox-sensitive bicupin YhaK (pirin superfamily) [Methylophilaceae bacterium]|jgi:redox-sensitive bicupin YhaK (pirin superfamily)